MASYYYLISSLPMLRAGDAPPLDYAAFLDQCRGAVSDRVYRSLEELTVRSEDGGFVSRWAVFYRVLQGELTYQRRVKRGCSNGSASSAMTRARPPSTPCSDRSVSRYSAYKKTGETKWRK